MLEGWQIAIVVLLSLIDASVVALSVVLAIYFKRKFTNQLGAIRLQQGEESLSASDSEEIYFAEQDEEETAEEADYAKIEEAYDEETAEEVDYAGIEEAYDEETAEDEDDEDDDVIAPPLTDTEMAAADDGEQNAFNKRLRILPVKDMTEKMRGDFGLVGEEFDDKRYYARYSYSFEAKMRNSNDSVKEFYTRFMNGVAQYKGMKARVSAKRIRVYKGTETACLLLFRGKSFWVAFALNPADYEGTKYRGRDMSAKKRYEKTPMLLKISSNKKLGYALDLLGQFAEKNSIVLNKNPKTAEFDLKPMSDGELYETGLLRIKLAGEAVTE